MLVSWTVVAGALVFALKVAAHGLVVNYTVDGVFYKGYWDKQHPWTKDDSPGPEWDTPGIGVDKTGFDKAPIFDSEFKSPDFVCHRGATPGRSSVKVGPGSVIVFQWPQWPRSHHGPVITMMANCEGSCHTVDKNNLKWNPLEKVGLIDPTVQNYPGEQFQTGLWAADKLIADDNTWTFIIPPGIAPGNYVLRHEIIALHATYGGTDPNPSTPYGGQFYPNCFNLEMTGTGTDPLASGTLASDLYSITEPGLSRTLWVFRTSLGDFKNYTIPGPPVYTPHGSGSSIVSAATVSTATVSTSSAPSGPTVAVSNVEDGGCGGDPPPPTKAKKGRRHPREVQSL